MISSPSHTPNPNYRADIDGLRAIAVLAVVLYHAFPKWLKGGFIGVDIFFVISGYLVTTIIVQDLNKKKFSFFEFYSRRIRRIFPAFLLVLSICLVFGWFFLFPQEYQILGLHASAATAFISNLIFLSESSYFDNLAIYKPLLHFWSLSIEEQFYILWPIVLFLAWRIGKSLIIVALLFVASFVLNIFTVNLDTAFFSLHTRAWELLSGALLAILRLHSSSLNFNKGQYGKLFLNTLSFCGLLVFVYGFLNLGKDDNFPGYWPLVPVLGTVLIILAGPKSFFNRIFLSNKGVVWFGLISYPLYLWHWPLISFAHIIYLDKVSGTLRLALVFCSILLACLTYYFIEKPIRSGGRNTFKVFSLLSLGLVVLFFTQLISKSIISSNLSSIRGSDPALVKFDLRGIDDTKASSIKNNIKEPLSSINGKYCFFNFRKLKFEEYIEKALDNCLEINPGKTNVMVIGDSHALDIYKALSETNDKINLLHLSGSGCHPIRSRKNNSCSLLVDYAVNFAANNPVDYVVLAARWDDSFYKLASEIKLFKSANKKVILFGPGPEFSIHVKVFILRRQDSDTLDKLSRKYFDFKKIKLNERMKAFALENNIQYVDRISKLCSSEGVCNLMNDESELYISDYGHLTIEGERFLGEQLLKDNLFKD